ncbi:MAG: anti-sigma factor [Bacteroidota bacterium]
MDPQSFIESGLLEAYILGHCTPEERVTVERMAAEHPSVKNELAAIEQALEQYATAQAVTPPSGLKNKIMESIDRIGSPVETAPPGPSGRSARIFQVISIGLAAATIVLAFNLNALKTTQTQLQQELAVTKANLKTCFDRSELDKQFVNLLRDTDTKPVGLSDDGKTFHAVTFYNPIREETVLDLLGLATPPPGKYMQFWGVVDGKPVSLGMIDLRSVGSRQSFKYLKGVEGFAISLEDNPQGVPSPTMVIMNGKIG